MRMSRLARRTRSALPRLAGLTTTRGLAVCSLAVLLCLVRFPCSAQGPVDVSGAWGSTFGFFYDITQSGDSFTWYVESIEELGQGTVDLSAGEPRLVVEWAGNNGIGQDAGSPFDASFQYVLGPERRPEFIVWDNGNIFFRNRLSTNKSQYASGEVVRIRFEAPVEGADWQFAEYGDWYIILDSARNRVWTSCSGDVPVGPRIEPGTSHEWEWDQRQVLCGDGGEIVDVFPIAPGEYTVVVSVAVDSGFSPGNLGIMQHSAEIEILQAPSIVLRWSHECTDENRDRKSDVGEAIDFLFTVTNNGNTTLTNIRVSVPGIEVHGGPIATLAVGPSHARTFTGTYKLTQADIDAGSVEKMATAAGTSPRGVTSTNVVRMLIDLPGSGEVPNGPDPRIVAAIAVGGAVAVLGGGFLARHLSRLQYEKVAKEHKPSDSCTSPGRYCLKKKLEVKPGVWRAANLTLRAMDPSSQPTPRKKQLPKKVVDELNAALDTARMAPGSSEVHALAESVGRSVLRQAEGLLRGSAQPRDIVVLSCLEDGSCKFRFTLHVCRDSRWVEKKHWKWEREIKVKREERITTLRLPLPSGGKPERSVLSILTESLVRFILRVTGASFQVRDPQQEGSAAAEGQREPS